jgi:hypothetical protein
MYHQSAGIGQHDSSKGEGEQQDNKRRYDGAGGQCMAIYPFPMKKAGTALFFVLVFRNHF